MHRLLLLVWSWTFLLYEARSAPNGCSGGRTKVVGAEEVTPPNSIPHQIYFSYNGNNFCGGSIIDQVHILTAGHCCNGASDGSIVAGEHDLCDVSGREQERRVSKEHRHEEYIYVPPKEGHNEVVLNDVCILTIQLPLEFNQWVQPVKLPEPRWMVEEGTVCRVSGWGMTEAGRNSDGLMYADLPIANETNCVDKWGGGSTIGGNSSHILCTGGGKQDSCNGDSGGPLTCGEVHTGVVSSGPEQCATPDNPGTYARTSSYVNWIRNYIASEERP